MRMHSYYVCMRLSSLFLTGQATSNLYEMFTAARIGHRTWEPILTQLLALFEKDPGLNFAPITN